MNILCNICSLFNKKCLLFVLIQMLSSDSNDLDGEEEDQHEDDELASKVYVSVSARSPSFAGSVSATVL